MVVRKPWSILNRRIRLMGVMKADGAIVVKASIVVVMKCKPRNGEGKAYKGKENELSHHQVKMLTQRKGKVNPK